jgi:SAM-dependent methyltransferase
MAKQAWFESWFDSPYYHILYQNHNEQEAKDFIDTLIAHFTPDFAVKRPVSLIRILDLACGKGRHSLYMAQKGFDVTGIDLSESSIRYATQFEKDNLSFFQHDMRKPFRINYFDFVFNIFTSFGYFDKDLDNILALKNAARNLKPDGVFVLDYFNSQWVRDNMKAEYVQTAGGINFHIQKTVSNGHIFKKIAFTTEGVSFKFQERVRLFSLEDFTTLFEKAGLTIIGTFGDYQLNSFNLKESKRLIIKAIKQ